MNKSNRLEAQVTLAPDRLSAAITDERSDSIEAFGGLPPEQQAALAVDAWRIGLHALRNAQAHAEEARLSEVGRTLKVDLTDALALMVTQHQGQMETQLRRYFDPSDGELGRRLERFIEDGGELPRLLAQFTAPDSGMLAQTLERHVGEHSPLLQKLSATDSHGIVHVLKTACSSAITDSQLAVQRALDPLNQESPVARFLLSLRDELKRAEADRSQQMVTAFKALDANDPQSMISNLQRQTEVSSRSLLAALNPANDNSPLATIRRSLTELLDQHAKTSHEQLRNLGERQERFEKDVLQSIVRLETQRRENRSTPRGGIAFEDTVLGTVRVRLASGPYVCSKTANTPGNKLGCKKGDFIVRFTDESAWAGATIVFEAKHETGWSVADALKELDDARDNRLAAVGVFVMDEGHASDDFPELSRIGNNILVKWSPEDSTTLYRLDAAVMLAMALATRKKQIEQHASVDAVRDIEAVLGEQLARVEKMRKASDQIKKHNEAIQKELRKSEEELKDLVDKAHETLLALDLNADDETAEREEPIEFGGSASSAAT